jgi:hypothetical protein
MQAGHVVGGALFAVPDDGQRAIISGEQSSPSKDASMPNPDLP